MGSGLSTAQPQKSEKKRKKKLGLKICLALDEVPVVAKLEAIDGGLPILELIRIEAPVRGEAFAKTRPMSEGVLDLLGEPEKSQLLRNRP
ncbi:uncharacterized protein A4U43_C08F18390 [Asparagus officinalis]|nr:uncharacterized protein A4U43_C08F18390 [Asparagus officinalis]